MSEASIEQDDRVRQEVDRRLVAVASLAMGSVVAWGTGLVLVLVRAAEGAPDVAVQNSVLAVATCSTLVAVILGQDLARRRRMKDQVKAVAEACGETVHAAVAEMRREMVEALAAMAAETEQMSAKVNTAEWAAWSTRLYGQSGEHADSEVVELHQRRGSGT